MEIGASMSRSPQVNESIIYDEPLRIDPGKNYESDEGNLRNFLQSCIKLIRDKKELEGLLSILNKSNRQVGGKAMDRAVNPV